MSGPARRPGDIAAAADVQIVESMAAGDRPALGLLYDRYADAVYSLACRIVGSAPDAEEVTQEVFTQAWTQAARYDPERASAAGWLLNMTRTRAIDRLRANKSRQRVTSDEELVAAAPAAGTNQEGLAIESERAARVRGALASLSAPQREAIELAYFGGLTHGEIAERLREPLGTIKTRIRSGLLKLRDTLWEPI